MSSKIIQNNHYYSRLLTIFDIKKHKYIYTTSIITVYFVIAGYKIIHDIIVNNVEPKYNLLRDLFIYNYFASLFYILISI